MKNRKYIVAGIIVLILVATFVARGFLENKVEQNEKSNPAGTIPQRIISLAPSITETLFVLGLGDKVVGRTRYCIFPEEAKKIPQLGGYYDPSIESMIDLNPDLVILLAEHEKVKESMEDMGIKTLQIEHRYIEEIIESFEIIGKACGAEEAAHKLMADTRRRIERIKSSGKENSPKRVMITVGRNMGSGSLSDVYIVGKNNFYDELINMAGGVNAYQGDISFPAVSPEGMLQMDPDIIIDLVADLYERGWDVDTIKGEWRNIPNLRAVKDDSIYVLGGSYVVVPGPRFILMAEEIAKAVNPEFEVEE